MLGETIEGVAARASFESWGTIGVGCRVSGIGAHRRTHGACFPVRSTKLQSLHPPRTLRNLTERRPAALVAAMPPDVATLLTRDGGRRGRRVWRRRDLATSPTPPADDRVGDAARALEARLRSTITPGPTSRLASAPAPAGDQGRVRRRAQRTTRHLACVRRNRNRHRGRSVDAGPFGVSGRVRSPWRRFGCSTGVRLCWCLEFAGYLPIRYGDRYIPPPAQPPPNSYTSRLTAAGREWTSGTASRCPREAIFRRRGDVLPVCGAHTRGPAGAAALLLYSGAAARGPAPAAAHRTVCSPWRPSRASPGSGSAAVLSFIAHNLLPRPARALGSICGDELHLALSRAFGKRDWVEHAAIDIYNTLAVAGGDGSGEGGVARAIPRCLSKQALDVCSRSRGATRYPYSSRRGPTGRRVIGSAGPARWSRSRASENDDGLRDVAGKLPVLASRCSSQWTVPDARWTSRRWRSGKGAGQRLVHPHVVHPHDLRETSWSRPGCRASTTDCDIENDEEPC